MTLVPPSSHGAGIPLTGWTSDNADPANVNTHGGNLNLGNVTGTLTAAVGNFAGGTVHYDGTISAPQTSGALATTTFVSGAGQALTVWETDVNLYVPWTTDGTNNVATLKVELSPDDMTYSELVTLSVAAAVNLVGALTLMQALFVPHGWFVKLTATHCTIGTCTGTGIID